MNWNQPNKVPISLPENILHCLKSETNLSIVLLYFIVNLGQVIFFFVSKKQEGSSY